MIDLSKLDIKPQRNIPGSQLRTQTDLIDSPYKDLIQQIDHEYRVAQLLMYPKIQEWQRRLKLYNNQKRDKDAIGDPLLFTVMQTVIASLYNDELQIEWQGRNEGDDEVAENLNHLAMYDADEMRKQEFDYYWLWDTGFFGHSLVYFTDFVKDRNNTPIPDLQNPMLFYRDDKAVAINGDISGKNAARFFGRDIEMTKGQMDSHPEFFDTDMLSPDNGLNSNVAINRQAYQQAQGLNPSFGNDNAFGDNTMFNLLEWCTHWQGKKVLVTLGNQRHKVVRFHEFKDADGKIAKEFPVIDRVMYPTAHDWDGTSIPDIIEDKQRMRAILMNLGIKHLQADLYPMYIYDKKRFKNRAAFNFGFNKFIEADGEGDIRASLAPLQKQQLNAAVHQYIMESLSQSAEKATSSPQMQQGSVEDQRRTATELSMVDRNVGTRYSLTAKVFAWSEKRFWEQWYNLYKVNFNRHIDSKVLRIEGAFGAKWRKLTRENIIADTDPDVKITSKFVARAERAQKTQEFTQYLSLVAQAGGNVRYGLTKLGKFIELQSDEIDRLMPPTIDQRIARDENDQLSDNKPVIVQATDDHEAHLEEHKRAADTTATFAHVKAHVRALELQKANPSLFGNQQPQTPGSTQAQQASKPGANQQQPPQTDPMAQLLLGNGQQQPPGGVIQQ